MRRRNLNYKALLRFVQVFATTGISILNFITTSASAHLLTSPENVTLQTAVNINSINGFLQTPAGGQPGTSFVRRPTLSELGMHDAVLPAVMLSAQWPRWRWYAQYNSQRLTGDALLTTALLSHAITIPGGSFIHSWTRFDWYRLGADYAVWQGQRFTLAPQLDMAILDFNYGIAYPGFSSRQYPQFTLRAGAYLRYTLTPRWWLAAEGMSSIPGLFYTDIMNINASVHAALLTQSHLTLTIFAGTGYEWIDFKDKQIFPNHVRLQTGVQARAGLELVFF